MEETVPLLKEGSLLSAAQASELERTIEGDPLNIDDRIRLLGYYRHVNVVAPAKGKGDPQKFFEEVQSNWIRGKTHLVWFLKNIPEHSILSTWSIHALNSTICDPPFDLDAFWDNLLKNRPDNVYLLRNAAASYSNKDYFKSVCLMEDAMRLDPDDLELISQCALYIGFAIRRKTTPEQVAHLSAINRTLESRAPANETVIDNRANIALFENEGPQIREAATMLLEKNPNSETAHIVMGLAYLKEGNLEGAREEMSKLRYPGDYRLHNEMLTRRERISVAKFWWRAWKRFGTKTYIGWALNTLVFGRPWKS